MDTAILNTATLVASTLSAYGSVVDDLSALTRTGTDYITAIETKQAEHKAACAKRDADITERKAVIANATIAFNNLKELGVVDGDKLPDLSAIKLADIEEPKPVDTSAEVAAAVNMYAGIIENADKLAELAATLRKDAEAGLEVCKAAMPKPATKDDPLDKKHFLKWSDGTDIELSFGRSAALGRLVLTAPVNDGNAVVSTKTCDIVVFNTSASECLITVSYDQNGAPRSAVGEKFDNVDRKRVATVTGMVVM